jgi:hypothetical protein
MTAPANKRTYIIGGFIGIILVYSLYNMYLVDVNYYDQIPRKVRHIARFLSIVMVYGIGLYTLKKAMEGWVINIWNIIYLVFASLLIIIGLYDWATGGASNQLRNIANTLHEFLISPVLFVALYIIYTKLLRKQ